MKLLPVSGTPEGWHLFGSDFRWVVSAVRRRPRVNMIVHQKSTEILDVDPQIGGSEPKVLKQRRDLRRTAVIEASVPW